MAYLNGTAVDADGNTHAIGLSDMRVFRGTYRSADGSTHHGTFAFIWIDLFDPGSGSQLHDFNGGIASSGLFWTIRIPDGALRVSKNLKKATLQVEDANVVDDLQIFGGANIPATVSFDLTSTAKGPRRHYKPGSTDPTDPTNFDGKFRTAVATATFSSSNAEASASLP